MAMLLSAMFSGPDYGWVIALLGFGGMVVGFVWLRRITGGEEDPDRSFYRYQGRRGGGSWIPGAPELPTWRWIVTRAALAVGIGAVVFAIAGPAALHRWDRVMDESFVVGVLAWIGAVVAATVGAAWIVRIVRRSPEDGAPPTWRYRD
jgi:hypothetical protein